MEVMGLSGMATCSHIPNNITSYFVRTSRADNLCCLPYNARMAKRRGTPTGPRRWYLPEWMAAAGIEGRGAQVRMMALTGWSKATMSQLFNGEQDFSPKILEDAAAALNIEPFELLMLPARAMAYRQLQATAATIVEAASVETKRAAG